MSPRSLLVIKWEYLRLGQNLDLPKLCKDLDLLRAKIKDQLDQVLAKSPPPDDFNILKCQKFRWAVL